MPTGESYIARFHILNLNKGNYFMSSNRLILLLIFLILLILLYAFFSMLTPTAKNVPALSVQQHQPEEVTSEGPVYTMVEDIGAIPTVQEIEENISKQRENKKRLEEEVKIAQKNKVEVPQETSEVQEFKNKSTTKIGSPSQQAYIPEKKEFKFPSYEERKRAESKTGAIAY